MAKRDSQEATVLTGETLPGNEPDWEPLLNILEEDVVEMFMWMFEVELEDGTRLHVYKHRWNRRSLHLSEDGRAFFYIWDDDLPIGPSQYQQLRVAEALSAVLGPPHWPEHEHVLQAVAEHREQSA